MGKGVKAILAAVFASAGLFHGASVYAQDVSQYDASSEIVAKFVASNQQRSSNRSLQADWDTFRLTLEGQRLRKGLRRQCTLYHCGSWHRAYRGEAMLGFDIVGPLQFGLRYAVSRDRHGNERAPVLTDGTGGLSQRISLEIEADANLLSASVYDNAGWQQGELGSLVEQLNNGEERAARGVSAGFARLIDDRRNMWLSFSLDQSQSPGFGADTTAIVRLSTVF